MAPIFYDSQYGSGNDSFSDADRSAYDGYGTPGYMTTPNGSLQKYDPTQPEGKRETQLSDSMHYDPKHPKPLKPKVQE